MISKREPTADADAARDGLLKEGAQSFLDAASAVIEYQREVHKVCRAVLERNLKEYSAALGITLSPELIEETTLDPAKWTGKEVSVGVFVRGGGKKNTGMSWWESCCTLDWEHLRDQGFWFGASVAVVMPRKFSSRLWEKVQRLGIAKTGHWEYGVWLGERIPADDAPHFEGKLDDLMGEWIELWKKVGGLKAITK